ncbi:PglZ domain-containing protein [Flavobacteriales bacterium]|nr:PglZ domain-containing protein [Flavobacteriales bacterium]
MAGRILWADDEIDLLKPHIMFLEQKGFSVDTINNGSEAIDMVGDNNYDIVFLDENMPGISGLEALTEIKRISPSLPIIMITKSEEESIMESAIGKNISDYLIKPVNPNQILLAIKKNIDQSRLISEETTHSYQQEFRKIGMRLMDRLDINDWKDLHDQLTFWELKMDASEDKSMAEIFEMQKREANQLFGRFIENNYLDWLNVTSDESPILSHTLFSKKIAPFIKEKNTFLIVIDNFRYDQWKILKPYFGEYFDVEEEDTYFSILPTATQYARNSLFAGLMPSEIRKRFPSKWVEEDEEGGKNNFEEDFLNDHLKRLGIGLKTSYTKITSNTKGKKLVDNFSDLLNNDFNVIVYNFVDMLSHARTDMEVIKELADDDSAYRSITESWFRHSPLLEVVKKIAESGCNIVLTTDHGMVKVDNPVKIVGDKSVNTNLRYKLGKNLSYNQKEVFEVKNPDDAFLPKINQNTRYVFCKDSTFFAYPNNYNYYVNFYKDTFQHGGISLEEVIIPIVRLKAKK